MATDDGSGSGMVRRQLGLRLRRLREDASKTHADISEARIMSVSKTQRMEAGKVAINPGDIYVLGRFYKVDTYIIDALAAMAAGTRDDGYMEVYGKSLPDWLGLYAGFERGASHQQSFHETLVFGLLQTHDYAHAIIAAHQDEPAPDVVEQRVKFRLERQKIILSRRPPRPVSVIMGAGALSAVMGSEQVMIEQRQHLKDLATADWLNIRVLPFTAAAHPATSGAFTILDFDDPADPALVHIETYVGAKWIEKVDQVDRFRKLYARLESESVPIKEYTQ